MGALGTMAVTAVLAVALLVGATYTAFASGVESPVALEGRLPRGGARITDRDGALLYEFVDETAGMRRPIVLADVSPWLIAATIATEDPTFFENPGVNFRGLSRAAVENVRTLVDGGTLGGTGGSSITQQLARNLYFTPAERSERTVGRKARETLIALELTRRYPKVQLLEWYLNSISYGGSYVGVEAAAEGYFGKSAKELTLSEAALLAGIPQAPAHYDPVTNGNAALGRQHQVLALMVADDAISERQSQLAAGEELVLQPQRFEIEAPHFVFGRVAEELRLRFGERALFDNGLVVRTTLNLELEKKAQEILERSIRTQESKTGGHNGSVLLLDAATGEVLAYVGSRDYFNDGIDGRVDNIRAVNSPGSALKPFVYLNAFMKGWGTGTGIIDAPLKLVDPSDNREIQIKNPIPSYQGVITAANALGNSLNVPAVKTVLYAGIPETVSLLQQIGFTTLDSPGGYGPAVAIGGADISLEDLVFSYSVLANGGVQRGQRTVATPVAGNRSIEPVAILEVRDGNGRVVYQHEQPDEQRVVPESAAYLVTSILSDGKTQCVTFGTCGALTIPGLPAAVKTGTSEPFVETKATHQAGETWAVGYTPYLVGGVWYGNSDNTLMPDVLSTQVGWPVLREFMLEATRITGAPPRPFLRPQTVVERQVCSPSGRLPSPSCPQARRQTSLFSVEAITRPEAEMRALQDTWWQPAGGGSVSLRMPLEDVAQWSREAQGWVLGKGTSVPGTAFVSSNPYEPRDLSVGVRAPAVGGAAAAGGAPPFAALTAPANGSRVMGTVLIRGSATAGEMRSATLEVLSAQTGVAMPLGIIGGPVLANQLGGWDTTGFPNGSYLVRVRVVDASGASAESQVALEVAN
jgi:membrane peptidoglycan carboxypeptidase